MNIILTILKLAVILATLGFLLSGLFNPKTEHKAWFAFKVIAIGFGVLLAIGTLEFFVL